MNIIIKILIPCSVQIPQIATKMVSTPSTIVITVLIQDTIKCVHTIKSVVQKIIHITE